MTEQLKIYLRYITFRYEKLFLCIRTYDELGSMGVDFGRLLETQAQVEENQSTSVSVSRSNSCTASITSLSSFMTNDTSKQEPDEVKSNFRYRNTFV